MERIYLNVAGLIIKISFGVAKRAVLSGQRKKIIKEISASFKGFLTDHAKNVDFYISFVEKRKEFNMLLLKQTHKMCYMRLYEEIGKNKIEVYYSLSIPHFLFILNYILSEYLPPRNGFMIHSSAIADGNTSCLFLGVPGAGKSTAAGLLKRQYKVLADDTGVVKKTNGIYSFYQVPFIEKITWIQKNKTAYPIKKIFILKKANFFKIEKITNKDLIINKLIRSNEAHKVLNFTLKYKTNKNYIRALLDFIANFDEFYYLYFAKDNKKLTRLLSEAE